jgi:beta-glucosidase
MTRKGFLTFPAGFIWGTATAAYQIEGAGDKDGRGMSIWDTFTRQPGRIQDGSNGDVACDHYHRWPADLDLMAELGLKAYRFSIAWPRILPEGTGKVNQAGLDFYSRLVDGLLERGIQPYVTLYHWDLPQALQDQGGWPQRTTAESFGEYSRVVGRRLGDRVQHWITHNEPMVMAYLGHLLGQHAPGVQDLMAALATAGNLLVSHGLAVQALRSVCPANAQVGITLNLSPVHPASETDLDRQAALRHDLATNRLFLDPVLKGSLPDELAELLGPLLPQLSPADLKVISEPIDFLGINYYSRTVVRHAPDSPLHQVAQVQPSGSEYSQMWEIYPDGIRELLTRVWKDYGATYSRGLRLLVTENGICVPDGVDYDGRVRDYRRIRYLRDHLGALWQAMQEGVPLDGYFVWSFPDNFEWAFGYTLRFGLVYVDYATQQRIVKDSGHWYAKVIRDNGLDTRPGGAFLPL